MAGKTPQLDPQLKAAYDECVPRCNYTSAYLDGLMMTLRPVLLGLASREDIGKNNFYRGITSHVATKFIDLSNPNLQVWQVALRDERKRGMPKKRPYASHIDVLSTYSTTNQFIQGTAKSRLTWSFANTDLITHATPYTMGGIGAPFNNTSEWGLDLYKNPQHLKSGFTEAYVARIAAGLLIARMVHGFSIAQDGQPLPMDRIEGRASHLFERWSTIDEVTAAAVLNTTLLQN